MTRKDIPNLISIFRIILVVPFAWSLIVSNFLMALILFAVAGASDALDGFLAKHFNWQSRLGSILDPIADKLLLVVSFATMAFLELLPMWLLWLVLARDVIIVVGALCYHYFVAQFELTPLWSSKINTALQILLILLVIIEQKWFPQLASAVTVGIWLVVASIVNSGSEYMLVWGLKAWKQMKRS